MNRDQFIDMLARAIDEGWLEERGAVALINSLDRGELDTDLFPLVFSEALALPMEDEFRAFLVLYGQLDCDASQDRFIESVRALAPQVPTSVATWQKTFQQQIAAYIRHQMEDGLGDPLDVEYRALWADQVQTQLAYLHRFADQVAVRALLNSPMSQEQIAGRSGLYAGAGRAAWFQISEQQLDDGWVCDYDAIDDAGTCDPCVGAALGGPYLPGSGPMPGDVCLGKGYCRCSRVPRYDPDTARRLRGQA